MNLYILLHQDHEKARTLFEQLASVPEEDQDRRERLFSTLYRELEFHAEAEERYFYPRLRANEETRESAFAAIEDHKGVKRLLGSLAAMDASTPEWTAKCRELRQECEAHIADEEGRLFPLARKVIGDEEAAGIAAVIESFKEEHTGVETT